MAGASPNASSSEVQHLELQLEDSVVSPKDINTVDAPFLKKKTAFKIWHARIYEHYRRTTSNPFFIPLANLCNKQALHVRAKVKILFYLDKYVRKNGIVNVDEDDDTEGSWMDVLRNIHYEAFFCNRFRN